jgi:hypothetical protein
MSEKILWNTVHIKVPSEFITIAKNGAVKIKPPLTRTKKISTANKQPAIQLETADVDKVMIVDEGKTEDANDLKSKRRKSVAQKRIDEPKRLSENAIKAEKESVHERMARLRSLRKSVKKLNIDNIVEETGKLKPLKIKRLDIKKLTDSIPSGEPDEKMSALIEKLEQREQTPEIKGHLEELNRIYKKYINYRWASSYENIYQKYFGEPTGQITEQTRQKSLWLKK